jgi:hypothetical protein
MVFRSDRKLFADIAALEVLRDPEQWLDRAPTLKSFLAPGPLARSEARRRYAEGESIYILGLDQAATPLRDLCDGLARDLGLAASYVTVEAWAAGKPTKVGMHFDLDFAFNLQVAGCKQWSTAPNLVVAHPTASHHVSEDEIIDATGEPSPSRMPDDARTWQMDPGDVVYLPQGVWHATQTAEPTVALAFAIKPPTWAQHLSEVLISRLHAEPRWRARVLGAREPSNQPTLRASAIEAISASASILAEVSASDLLYVGAWGGAPESFERADGVTDVGLTEAGGRLVWSRAGRPAEMRVPPWARRAIEFVVESTAPWSIAAIHDLGRVGEEHLLNVMVLQMVRAGFLRKAIR